MKVAQLGNGKPPNSTENELRRAMLSLGWDVDFYQEDDPTGWHVLTSSVKVYDLVMWTRTASLAPDHETQWRMIEAADAAGVPTVAYHLDRWWGLAREREVRREPFFRCAHVCTADGGHEDRWAELGIRHHWFPPAVSEFECVPGTPRDEFRSEIGFVGGWDGYGHPEAWHRPALVQWLRSAYGARVAFWPKRGEHAVRGAALRDLVASVKLWVGDSCILSADEATERGLYWSDRIPELLGRGAVVAHPDTKGLEDEHFSVLRWPMGNWGEGWYSLRGLIDDWLARPDDEVRAWGELGRDHTLLHHTYTVRMRQMADMLGLA